jgi:hypothetical protein
MRRAVAIASIWPDGAQAACRTMSGIRPLTGILPISIWWQRSAPNAAGYAILRSHPPLAGDAHRVLLRNPYADIGLTCLDGQAAVWIGERIDRDYRIRCEWSDVSGPARLWLASIAPTFEASAARLGFAPIHQPVDQPWLKAA